MSTLRQIFPHSARCVKLWRAPLDNIDHAKDYFAYLGSNKRAIEITVGYIANPKTGRITRAPDLSLDLARNIMKSGLDVGSFDEASMRLTDFFEGRFQPFTELEVSLLEFSTTRDIGFMAANKKGRTMRP